MLARRLVTGEPGGVRQLRKVTDLVQEDVRDEPPRVMTTSALDCNPVITIVWLAVASSRASSTRGSRRARGRAYSNIAPQSPDGTPVAVAALPPRDAQDAGVRPGRRGPATPPRQRIVRRSETGCAAAPDPRQSTAAISSRS